MPICIVIFIMDTNPFGNENIPYKMYNCLDGDEYFRGNESRIIIFNGEYEADDAISSLMKEHDKIANDILRNSVVKYTKEGRHMVYNPLQENYEAGVMDGKIYGMKAKQEEDCIAILKKNVFSDEEIADLLKMSLKDVVSLKNKLKTGSK